MIVDREMPGKRRVAARGHERFCPHDMARSTRIYGIVINQISLVMFLRV